MILIDNYDSFTYNIVQYLNEIGVKPKIFENDKITIEELKCLDFESIVISPGAGNPDTAGVSMKAIQEFYKTKKILGICLGHQCISQFFCGEIVKSKNPTHGKVSEIFLEGESLLFRGLPQSFKVMRYHSLEVKNVPLKITAKTNDGTIMAIGHESLPIYGVQFHPESILTQYGHEILYNFVSS